MHLSYEEKTKTAYLARSFPLLYHSYAPTVQIATKNKKHQSYSFSSHLPWNARRILINENKNLIKNSVMWTAAVHAWRWENRSDSRLVAEKIQSLSALIKKSVQSFENEVRHSRGWKAPTFLGKAHNDFKLGWRCVNRSLKNCN